MLEKATMTQSGARPDKATGQLSEHELVARVRGGDGSAFRIIMERNNTRLYRLARSLMKDEVEAEDVLQEAYLRAFSNLSSFRGDSSLATWLARITLNEALGRKRKEKPMLPLQTVEFENQTGAQIINFPTMANENDPEQLVARLEIRKLLENAIDTLPEMFRLVFIMREVEDMSVDETAELLNTRPQTVKTRLHRARRLLRASLDDRLSSTLKETFPFAGARCARITARVLERLSMGE